LEDPGIDGKIKWVFRKWNGIGMYWIDLADDRYRSCGLENKVMKLRVPHNAENFMIR